MQLKFSQELEELACLFPDSSPLYVVGGCVRDYISNDNFDFLSADIDLTSNLTPNELTTLLKDSGFAVAEASLKLGTMIIKKKKSYEYTCFRWDSYPTLSGEHLPSEVSFCKDIVTDAKRRDFKCNAVYYDVKNNLLLDPLGQGIEQIKNKILDTTIDPSVVLSQDGLRIMRLFRFVSVLGYEISEKTYEQACISKHNLKDISPQRIAKELDLLLGGEYCYQALCGLRDSGVLDIILPELARNKNTKQNAKYHKYDVLEHTFQVVKNSPPHLRLSALMHDIAKTDCQNKDGNMYNHAQEGAKMCRQILESYGYPKKVIQHTCKLVLLHMYDLQNNAKQNTLRLFVAKNQEIIKDLVQLKHADIIGTGFSLDKEKESRLWSTYQDMLSLNLPMSIQQLDINGQDLQKFGYHNKQIGDMLQTILELCIIGQLKNQKSILLQWANAKKK